MCFMLLGQYVLLISLCFSPALKTELQIPLTVFFLSCLSLQYLGGFTSSFSEQLKLSTSYRWGSELQRSLFKTQPWSFA